MSDRVTLTITVDRDMFPYPPGSEVVCRDFSSDRWGKYLFAYADTNHQCRGGKAYKVVGRVFTECHPLATHGHLIGTTYPSDTPACAKCGKAQPDCVCVKVQTFAPFQKVLVRDNANSEWQPSFYRKYDPDSNFPYFTICSQFKQCIPYEGNEHLLGTKYMHTS